MAIANGWVDALSPQVLQGIARRQSMIAIDPNSDARDSSRAAGVVVKIVDQVQRQEDRDAGITGESSVNVGVQVGATVQAALTADPSYLEWLRDRELAEGGQPHVVGQNGHSTNGHALPDTGSHQGNGSSGNGHHPGNGRH